MRRELCFVLMPFGKKKDAGGIELDFDAIYHQLIEPSVRRADLEPYRTDEEMNEGITHKAIFERLILTSYALVDLTTANASVFYELGVRHALRPWSTVLVFANGARMPFDVASLQAFLYRVTQSGAPTDIDSVTAALVQRLREAYTPRPDRSIFQLVEGMHFTELEHSKTDIFRDRIGCSSQTKELLADARRRKPMSAAVEALRELQREMGSITDADSAAVVDLFLSFRDVRAWNDMIALVKQMSPPLAETAMVRQQLSFALNRAGNPEGAERELLDLLNHRGASSGTYGLLGRVYKDRWEAAVKSGEQTLARGLLDKATNAYLRGFEADWRDAYPGVNAVTLMELREPPDPRRFELVTVVGYAVKRKIAAKKPDYWDYATLLELDVLSKDEKRAGQSLIDALAAVRAEWEPETTARNLRLIREARERRGDSLLWPKKIEDELNLRAGVRA